MNIIDMAYQITGAASVIVGIAAGLAGRHWIARMERRQERRR